MTSRKKKAPDPGPTHLWMPDGAQAVCDHFGKRTHLTNVDRRRWNASAVTCRSCLAGLRKHPQLANQIARAREPELPGISAGGGT